LSRWRHRACDWTFNCKKIFPAACWNGNANKFSAQRYGVHKEAKTTDCPSVSLFARRSVACMFPNFAGPIRTHHVPLPSLW
jgi:hypothetical protein